MKRSEGWLSGPPVRQIVVLARTRATGLRLLGPHLELNRSVAAVRHDVVSILIQPLAAVTLGHPCGGNVRRVEAPTRIPRTSPHLLDQHLVVRLPRSAAGEGLAVERRRHVVRRGGHAPGAYCWVLTACPSRRRQVLLRQPSVRRWRGDARPPSVERHGARAHPNGQPADETATATSWTGERQRPPGRPPIPTFVGFQGRPIPPMQPKRPTRRRPRRKKSGSGAAAAGLVRIQCDQFPVPCRRKYPDTRPPSALGKLPGGVVGAPGDETAV